MKNIKRQAPGWIIIFWLMGLLTYHWGMSTIEDARRFKQESRTHDFMLNNTIEVNGASGIMVGWDAKAKIGYVLTCAHVVRNHKQAHVAVIDKEGWIYDEDCPIIVADDDRDLALVQMKRRMPLFTIMSDLDFAIRVRRGMTVWAAGYPTLDTPGQMLTVGHILDINRSYICPVCEAHEKVSGILHDATIWYGCSGGPLVEPHSGEVVGLDHRLLSPELRSNRGMAIPAPVINKFLREAGVK